MASKKINLTFITPNLFAGGAERVISFLAKELDREKFNVTLVVFGYEKDASYNLEGIHTVFFNRIRVLNGALDLFTYLIKNKPDVVMSVIEHLNTVVAYQSIFFPKTKFIAREVNVLSVLQTFATPQPPIMRFIYKNRFRFFDAVVCQSQDMLEDMNTHFKISEDKLHVINNPITDGFEVKTTSNATSILKCITVGRLAKEKGHDRLLKALSKVSIPFHLTLIGSGPQKDYLYGLIDSYGLTDKVTHIPFTKEVNNYLRQSDVYLQSSYTEGFPNAVIESCAVGTPIIAFRAPGGLNEIIIDGVNGHIAENEDEFLEYIESIHTNNIFVPDAVSESVYSKFNKETVLKKYEDLFLKLATQ